MTSAKVRSTTASLLFQVLVNLQLKNRKVKRQLRRIGRSAFKIESLYRFTYNLFHMHDNSDERNLLLLHALGDQIVLEKVRVVDVATDVPNFSLLLPQALLALTGTCRE